MDILLNIVAVVILILFCIVGIAGIGSTDTSMGWPDMSFTGCLKRGAMRVIKFLVFASFAALVIAAYLRIS